MGLYDPYPKYATTKPRLISTVLLTALFSLVVQLLVMPFVQNTWLFGGIGSEFLLSVIFEAMAFGVIVIGKWVMYNSYNKREFTYLHFGLLTLGESAVIALIYSFITIGGYYFGYIQLHRPPTLSMTLLGGFIFSLICTVIPYILALQYFDIMDKNKTIRLMNFSTVVSDTAFPVQQEEKVTLCDDFGTLKLVLSLSSIYYVESDDNYIRVWYRDSAGELRQYMLRCRLKTVEESFAGSDLVRCHRKYIVNVSKIESLRFEKDGYYVDLGLESAGNLPVSKTYEEKILSKFNSR